MSRHTVLVSAGGGPVEVRRFVARLAERLEALAADEGLCVRDVTLRGDEDAPWSVELVVEGDAPARLSAEVGTHALVARSPERGRAARKRWFAGVTIHPLDEAPVTQAPPDPRDLEVTATTSPGPGGQHVNKTATAVRVRHLPSGITVRVAEERSQRRNLERAVARIAERLAHAAAAQRADGEAARRLQHHRVVRGAPVRTYRLDPRGAGLIAPGDPRGTEARDGPVPV
jgi:peptide chain release factor 2/peptide chain release factor